MPVLLNLLRRLLQPGSGTMGTHGIGHFICWAGLACSEHPSCCRCVGRFRVFSPGSGGNDSEFEYGSGGSRGFRVCGALGSGCSDVRMCPLAAQRVLASCGQGLAALLVPVNRPDQHVDQAVSRTTLACRRKAVAVAGCD